jgi:tellurite resistance protein TehA-like permease
MLHNISQEPKSYHSLNPPGLYYIALTIYLLTLLLFLTLLTCTILRLLMHPTHFLASFTSPAESFFLGSFYLSISVLIGGLQTFSITHGPGYPWLLTTVYILYWTYAAISLLNSIFQYWVLIQYSTVRPVPFMPSIFLAGYSAMLTGTLASLIAGHQSPGKAVMVIVSGVAFQGFGWCVSFVAIVSYTRNLLDKGFPLLPLRPALFIPVGACAYTIVALVGMARAVPEYGYFARHQSAKETLSVVALFSGIFLWVFAFWLFAIAFLGNVVVVGRMKFSLSWWAFVFPNVGFTLCTSAIGRELESEAILWVASGMTIALVLIWMVAVVGCIRAVWRREIVWPGRDEDKDR